MIILAIDINITDKKLQYNINRETTKILILSLSNIDKYEIPSNQIQVVDKVKFAYSPLGKVYKAKKDYYNNLDHENGTDNKTCWKSIKPLFS